MTKRSAAKKAPRQVSHHPVNKAMVDDAPIGARIADQVTGFMGSWRFLILQAVLVAAWLAGNIYLLSKPFDPYPFILLNLAFSTQAAYVLEDVAALEKQILKLKKQIIAALKGAT